MADWTGQPVYKQIADDLRARIRDGRLPVGTQLPSLAELMQEYGVSITVVRMAIAALRAEGLVTTHQGKGAFVRSQGDGGAVESGPSPEFEELMSHLEAIHEDIRRLDERLAQVEALVQPTPEPQKRSR
jgi:GntR family transcriptional regulator